VIERNNESVIAFQARRNSPQRVERARRYSADSAKNSPGSIELLRKTSDFVVGVCLFEDVP